MKIKRTQKTLTITKSPTEKGVPSIECKLIETSEGFRIVAKCGKDVLKLGTIRNSQTGAGLLLYTDEV